MEQNSLGKRVQYEIAACQSYPLDLFSLASELPWLVLLPSSGLIQKICWFWTVHFNQLTPVAGKIPEFHSVFHLSCHLLYYIDLSKRNFCTLHTNHSPKPGFKYKCLNLWGGNFPNFYFLCADLQGVSRYWDSTTLC